MSRCAIHLIPKGELVGDKIALFGRVWKSPIPQDELISRGGEVVDIS